MMRRRFLPGLLAAVISAGCYDFVAPEFGGGGANPVIQLSVVLSEQGNLTLSGLFAPGIDTTGFNRNVPRDTIDVFGLKFAPLSVRENGTREYNSTGKVAPALAQTQPLELSAPQIQGHPALPPAVTWFPIQRADPDTIYWQRGSDLVLHIDTAVGVSVPTPRIRQWFLEMRSTNGSFRVSSDGLPPAELHIPSEWVPATTDSDIIAISLAFHQSSRLEPETANYSALFDFTFIVNWVVVVLRT